MHAAKYAIEDHTHTLPAGSEPPSNGTLHIYQGTVKRGQFTANQIGDSTVTIDPFPKWMIVMWSGMLGKNPQNNYGIPVGWSLCNGQEVNGMITPDLRGRFIVGAGNNIS